MVSAIIIASNTSNEMQEDLKEKGEKTRNKLLLRVGYPLVTETVTRVLGVGVDECLLVLRDGASRISKVVEEEVREDNLKIIHSKADTESEVLLEGVNKVKTGLCLCIWADQPAITPDTMKNLINKALDDKTSNIIPILTKKSRFFNSLNCFEMPFVCHTDVLKKCLFNKKTDINSILKGMKDNFSFYGIQPIDNFELLKIDDYSDYEKLLKGKNYKNPLYKSILRFFSLSNLSINFQIYFIIFSLFCIVSYFFHLILPNTDLNSSISLLTTLIQSEASIIAIVVTLSLVAVQLTASSYSTRVIDIFKRELSFWILIITYTLAITYGIIILKFINGNNILNLNFEIWIAVYMAIFALFALIPYILDILDIMKPSIVIKKLESGIQDHEVLSFIRADHKKDPVQPIIDVIHSSLMKHDYGTLSDGLDSIEHYNKFIYKNKGISDNEKGLISDHILRHITRVGKLAVNLKDDYATSRVMDTLFVNAKGSVQISYTGGLLELIYNIRVIAKSAVENDLIFTSLEALDVFDEILRTEKNLPLVKGSILGAFEEIEESATNENVLIKLSMDITRLKAQIEDESKK